MPSGYGYGAAEGLQEVLAGLMAAAQTQREAERYNQQQQRQQLADAETTRRWNLTHERQLAADKVLADMRAAEAARDRADAEGRAARTKTLLGYVMNPSSLTSLPKLGRLIALNQAGVANVGLHDVETDEEHRTHLAADDDTAWNKRKRELDYTETQRRSRPPRVPAANLRLIQDDPSYPRGVQAYVVQLRSKYPTFDAALAEANRAIPDLQAAHPNLSPQKFLNGLRQAFTGSGRAHPDATSLATQAVGGAMADDVWRSSGGRGAGPGGAGASQRSAATQKTVTVAELQALATARGTTVEQEKARATAAGYVIR